jgi:hypothetical protein
LHSCTHAKDHRQVLRIRICGDEPVAGHSCEGTPAVRHLRYTCVSLAQLKVARSLAHVFTTGVKRYRTSIHSVALASETTIFNHLQPSPTQLNFHTTQHFKRNRASKGASKKTVLTTSVCTSALCQSPVTSRPGRCSGGICFASRRLSGSVCAKRREQKSGITRQFPCFHFGLSIDLN